MKRRLLLLLLLALLYVANTGAIYVLLTSQRDLQVWDFQPLWQAGRWILQGRGDPYSDEMTLLLQNQSYGRPAESGEDARAFVYPLYVLLLVLPLIFLPLPLAQAAWFTALEFGAGLGMVGALRLVGWRARPLQTFFMVVWGFLLYPLVWAFALGQVSLLIFVLFVLTLLALQNDLPGLAGVCLALTTSKPQMSFLLVPALLLWGLVQRRYRFLVSFAAAMVVLLSLSFAILPGWLGGVLRATSGYFAAQPFPPPVALLGQAIGGAPGQAVTALLAASLLAGLAWAWWQTRHKGAPPLWATSLTLVITTLIAPRTSIVNQTSLLVPLCLLFAETGRLGHPRRQAGFALGVLVLGGLWAIDWLCFPAWSSGQHWHAQHRILSPILPVVLLVGLGTCPWWAREAANRR